jgi:hypothetical protein
MTWLAVCAVFLLTSPVPTEAAQHHVKATLVAVGDSGVTGQVQLVQLPHGGTNIHVVARGLTPGSQYTSFYYDNTTCSSGPDAVGTFAANQAGVGQTNAKIDDDLDEVGSVSVRTPDYQTIFACAAVR